MRNTLIGNYYIPEEWEEEPRDVNVRRVFEKIRLYWERLISIPRICSYIIKNAIRILLSPKEFIKFLKSVWNYINQIPIVVFYKYLWSTKPKILLFNLFVSYAFPAILEALPWYFSRRKISKELRILRNNFQHRMLKGKMPEMPKAFRFVGLTLTYALIQTLDQHLRNRVMLMNKYVVKRLLMERLIYSEIYALDFFKDKTLERRINTDVQATLHLFSQLIPQIISTCYEIVEESRDLYARRDKIDVLALSRPFILMTGWKIVNWVKETIFGKRTASSYFINDSTSELFATVVDGIQDVQLHNLQNRQLDSFDKIMGEEFNSQEDFRYFFNQLYNRFTNQSIGDFLSEMYVTSYVMKKKKMSHEEFRKIQLDINHIVGLFRRVNNYRIRATRVIDNQARVMELMSLPNFQNEYKIKPLEITDFKKMVISDIKFSYASDKGPPYALNFKGTIAIEKGKTYAIIGQNRSGKSTLAHLLCKLYEPVSGNIILDDKNYSDIQRISLRNMICYVAQKPFIFPGTIMENILVGNPNASEDKVIEAATLSGIFLFDELQLEERKKEKLIKLKMEQKEDSVKIILKPKKKKTELSRKRKLEILNMKCESRGTNLSGGFQQSVALARAFVKTSAKIIILDESMSQMDPIKKKQCILPQLFKFCKRRNISLIYISHDMSDVHHVDHIIMFEAGNIVCQGSHDDLIKSGNKKYLKMIGKE